MNADDNTMAYAGQASWRSQVLQGTLWVFTLMGVPAAVYVVATNSRGLTHPATLLAFILIVLVVLVAFSRRWPFAWRAVILIGVTYTSGLLAVLYYGFTLGSGLLMLLVVVLGGLFFDKRWLWLGLLVTGASLACVGALHTTGVIATQRLDLLDFSRGETVVRGTLVYLVLAGTIAVSMSYIVRRIERSLQETSEALARYEAEKHGRTAAETALRESEATYRQLVEDINDVIYAIDETGVFTYLSPAVEAHSGYKPSELIGQVFSDFVEKEDRPYILNQFAATLSGHLQPSEFRVVTKSGAIRWIRSSSRPIYRAGQAVGLRGVYIDITEKRELEEELRQAHKMEAMGTLAGGIAHEFNNMLAGMLGFTQLATTEVPPTSRVSQYLQEVSTAGNRAKDLVQQILAFSHPSAHDQEPMSLSLVIQEALKFLRASLPTTIEIRQQIVPETGMVLADATQLHQVLMNLCTNAEYAMRETGGTLEVGVATVEIEAAFAALHPALQPGPHVRVTVGDTGRGMSPEIVERIFDPFFTTKGIGEGTGMGLAIVHGIVTSHDGVMTVESTPGEGTTFAIYLPQIAHDTATTADLPEHVMPQGTGRILFVDDEEMLAHLGQVQLTDLGYEVEAYTSSLEALAAFRATPDRFDLVITDQTMPDMTGEQLARELRQCRSDIPIILCTGFSHVINAESAREQGIDAYCMKPMDVEEFTATIQTVLEQRQHIETSSIKKR